MRAGDVARAYVEMLIGESTLPLPPLKQGDLFDKNPGPWTLDDEDFARQSERQDS